MSTPPTAPAAVPVLVEPTKVRAADGSVRQVSVPPAAPPVRRGSLAEIPFDNAREAPADAVLSRKQPDGGWRDVSAADFADEVLAVAKGLIAEGLGAGDRIAIMARTTYEWTLLDFAAWAAGLVTVPIYPTSSAFQTRWILQDSGAVACAVETADQGRLISQERKQLGDLAHLWQFDTGALGRLKTLGRDVSDDTVAARRATLEPETPATLIYTSGTTGRPKGCVLSHGNFFAEVDNAIELLHPVFKSVSKDPASTLLFLPLSHVFGRMVAIGCLRARVRLGHAPSIQTEDLLADLAGFEPTFLLAIPYVLEKVYNTGRATAEKMGRASSFDRAARIAQRYGEAVEAAEHGTGPGPGLGLRAARALYDPLVYRRIRAALGGHVRYAICGGSPLGHRLAAFYAGAGIEIFEGYGLTETTAAATVTPPLKPRLGTVGWPLPGTAVRIADDGEVLLGGGQVCQGYWDAEQGRPVPVQEGGWFATGDLGALDEDGYLTITGRKKDIIITSGGKNVTPAPLEDWLRAHPLVSQCMVVGDNRSFITALITLEPDGLAHWRQMKKKQNVPMRELVDDEELRTALQRAVDEANRLVSRAESIRKFAVLPVDFTEENGHLTPSLKLKRDAIARDFEAEIEALYRK
ncbi:AMP-dependent synthetase/ligase [Streptomyces sp. NBC_00257]|uniref:AMP-dependent synthetase/ligase n=1 Tax=unclassified Streptomyces TaxID=2593676 RepID=UPI002257D923|nr:MULTISPECIES: AMP-dependent synthetase/ligase [unclassified Streptomyces]WTB54944.1 AMP-dependent synthetase/ligase [Streptomyces sp. NBC_00826]WTC96721.1 AMP-dependent synthetase/ligase [Streptomyces sp. NBC_01650]WTH92171.1 AMP-dependent synthetase/ligase [Streptomyces sp. NBC_00825]WTI00900.1 AMP-dependent synthetase/ligase [Streptomyces sp. NBC_00822]MCX4866435.1 AMP-dependent synthetase/ligase [Streptomyces sp. NBC_00906]